MRLFVVLLTSLFTAVVDAASAAPAKLALVIGNAKYPDNDFPMSDATNDAYVRQGIDANNTDTTQQNVVIGSNNQASSVWIDGLGSLTAAQLVTALRYAERGWPVLPIKSMGKEPLTRSGDCTSPSAA